jgi:hypothetical protein
MYSLVGFKIVDLTTIRSVYALALQIFSSWARFLMYSLAFLGQPCRSTVGFFTAGKLAPGNLGLLQQYRHISCPTPMERNVRSWCGKLT